MTSVSIRLDAHHRIGYGHLKRCLVLGDALRSQGVETSFLIAGDDLAKDIVVAKGFSCALLSGEPDFSQQAENLFDEIPDGVSLMITDLAHAVALKDAAGLGAYFDTLHRRYRHVAIDGSGEISLRHGIPNLACDVLVSPYVGETGSEKPVCYRELLGTDYFVIGEEYTAERDRTIRAEATRVLVTCGGSDPTFVTSDIVSALALYEGDSLEVRIIIGPGFQADYVERIRRSAEILKHDLSFINSPENIADQMYWCDLAISTSGLTKYELAATGTPAILMSIDSYHHAVNQNFSGVGSVTDLGIADDVSGAALAETITALLKDSNVRQKQSSAGGKLVDGKGAQRLALTIKDLAQPQ